MMARVGIWRCNRNSAISRRINFNIQALRKAYSSDSIISNHDNLVEVSGAAREDAQYVCVMADFARASEETSVVREMSKTFRGKKYQFDHWDKVIEGYKETEKGKWTEESQPLVERLQTWTRRAVKGAELELLEKVHVLDLAEEGEIRPHIDSVKFCGEVIAGVSLLSSSVMKLQHKTEPDKWMNLLLPRLSLYCLIGKVRYEYTHAIPKGDECNFMGKKINRERRLSLICRTVPQPTGKE